MSAASCVLSDEYFLCPICLDLFNTPVTVPCGHNFCKNCIIQNWKINRKYQCPVCKKHFNPLPDLNVNTFVSEMVAQFKQAAIKTAAQELNPGEVPCDICTGKKKKSLKSCLVCVVSYCEMHLEKHQKVPRLKKHKLIDPVVCLEDNLCTEHEELIDSFCKTDQMCICKHCAHTSHDSHHIVSMKQECAEKIKDLGKTADEIREKIEERQMKLTEFACLLIHDREESDKWKTAASQLLGVLLESIQFGCDDFLTMIHMKHEALETEVKQSMNQLNHEIWQLKEKDAEVLKLCQSEFAFQFLQNLPHLNTSVPTKDWKKVSAPEPEYEDGAQRFLDQMKETLIKKIDEHFIGVKQPLEQSK